MMSYFSDEEQRVLRHALTLYASDQASARATHKRLAESDVPPEEQTYHDDMAEIAEKRFYLACEMMPKLRDHKLILQEGQT